MSCCIAKRLVSVNSISLNVCGNVSHSWYTDQGDAWKYVKYPNIIKHLSKYKNKLLKRRECVRGLRKWYELQWGRNNIIFDENKIVFPYKASTNKFYIDEENLYFSADIYSITIKDESIISYIDLSKILNSKLYNFYFKCFGKKLGMDLYEYYPNTVMRLMIPLGEKFNKDKDIYNYFGITSEEIKIIEQCI